MNMKTILLILSFFLVIVSCTKAPSNKEKSFQYLNGTWVNDGRIWDTIVFVDNSTLTKTWASGDKETYSYTLKTDSIIFNHIGPLKILIPPYAEYFSVENNKLTLISSDNKYKFLYTKYQK
jgi:hypothetical protein